VRHVYDFEAAVHELFLKIEGACKSGACIAYRIMGIFISKDITALTEELAATKAALFDKTKELATLRAVVDNELVELRALIYADRITLLKKRSRCVAHAGVTSTVLSISARS